MATQQVQPWMLMDNFKIAGQDKKPLAISAPFDVSMQNPNQGMSLEQANNILNQQSQAAILGATPLDQQPQQDYGSQYAFGITPFSQTKEGQALLAEEKAKEQEALALQQQGIKSAEERLQSYLGKEKKLDLTPLLNLSDMWFGGNLKAGYKAPITEEQRSRAVQELQDAILKAKTGYSENVLQSLKNMRAARQGEQDAMLKAKISEAQINAMLSGQRAKQATQKPDKELEIVDKITKSKEAEKIRGTIEMNTALNNYIDTINKHQNNIASAEARADIGQAYNDTLMAFKNANTLGALAQADLETARQKLPDLSSYASYLNRRVGLTPDIGVVTKLLGDMKSQYSKAGQTAIKTLEAGYGKFGGQDILNKFKSDLESSTQGSSMLPPSRADLIQQEMQKRQMRGISQ